MYQQVLATRISWAPGLSLAVHSHFSQTKCKIWRHNYVIRNEYLICVLSALQFFCLNLHIPPQIWKKL